MSLFRRRLMMSESSNPYIELDYIESTGTQCVDMNVVLNTNDIIEVKAKPTQSKNYNTIVGSYNGSIGYELYFDANNNLQAWGNIAVLSQSGNPLETVFKYTGPKTRFPNLLFEYSIQTASRYPLIGRIYYCRIKRGTSLLRDLIPVIRKSDGKVCMYDKVSKQFFTNRGTGEFTGGSNVS